MSRPVPTGTIREQIVELAARPEGVTNNDLKTIMGMHVQCVTVNLQALEYQRRVIRAKADGHRLRWFKHEEHRQVWLEAMKAERVAVLEAQAEAKRLRERVREAAKTNKRRAEKAAKPVATRKPAKRTPALPVNFYTAGSSKVAPKIPSAPVDYSRAKYIIDDKVRAVAAWQNQPSQPPVGFAAAGIGRYIA